MNKQQRKIAMDELEELDAIISCAEDGLGELCPGLSDDEDDINILREDLRFFGHQREELLKSFLECQS